MNKTKGAIYMKYSLKSIMTAAQDGGFVREASWYGNRDFWSFHKAGSGLISTQDQDSEIRYRRHQNWNLAMQKMRARFLGVKIVFGFFERGNCKEISLFSRELFVEPAEKQLESSEYPLIDQPGRFPTERGPEYPDYYLPVNIFRRVDPDYTHLNDIVIGWGCEDLQIRIRTQLDLSKKYSWFPGDADSEASYDPETKTFVRSSHTGRHNYKLKINDQGICIPLVPMFLEKFIQEISRKVAYSEEFRKYAGRNLPIALENIAAGKTKKFEDSSRGQIEHGYIDRTLKGLTFVTCVTYWSHGNASWMDRHCLEIFQDSEGKLFLVDQWMYGDCHGKVLAPKIICEIPKEIVENYSGAREEPQTDISDDFDKIDEVEVIHIEGSDEVRRQVQGVWQHTHGGYDYWHPMLRVHKETN